MDSPYEDSDSDMGMSGPVADATFMRAFEYDLIGVRFDSSGGPHASTAIAWVTNIKPKGLEMLGAWEEPSQQPTQQFIFNASAYGAFGNQHHFQFEQVIGDLDRQIEEHGGDDKDELRKMVEEIQGTLESQDSITRSKFEKWSELANEHAPWLLGPLGTLFINYVFGTPGGGS